MIRAVRVFALLVLVTIARAPFDTVFAQGISSASIEGTVTDETSAALPGVAIALTSPSLQVAQREAVTDGEGRYRFVDLPIGTYTLQFNLPGFQVVRREGIQLSAAFA